MSSLFKDITCYVGQSECYGTGSEVIRKTTGIEVSDNMIHRLCNELGEKGEEWLAEDREDKELKVSIGEQEVVYAHCDGGMVYTRTDEWKEVKVGRVYRSGDLLKESKNRGYIHHSWYTFHLGGHKDFEEKMSAYLDDYAHLEERLVVIVDGAKWIRNWISTDYPKATQILDFYHAMEHLAGLAKLVIHSKNERTEWLKKAKDTMKTQGGKAVLDMVEELECKTCTQIKEKEKLINYIHGNLFRMDYPKYQEKGLQIGSGAIEAAHRTLVQKRCKLSGQRWTPKGVTNILNLRNLRMNGRWSRITDYLRNAA